LREHDRRFADPKALFIAVGIIGAMPLVRVARNGGRGRRVVATEDRPARDEHALEIDHRRMRCPH
jgi:hypothetical protein